MRRRNLNPFVCLLGDLDPIVPWAKLGYAAWQARAEAYHRARKGQHYCARCGRYEWPDEEHSVPERS